MAAKAARALAAIATGGAVGIGAVEDAAGDVVGEDVVAGGGGEGGLAGEDVGRGHAATVGLGLRRAHLEQAIGASGDVAVSGREEEGSACLELRAQRDRAVAGLHLLGVRSRPCGVRRGSGGTAASRSQRNQGKAGDVSHGTSATK